MGLFLFALGLLIGVYLQDWFDLASLFNALGVTMGRIVKGWALKFWNWMNK